MNALDVLAQLEAWLERYRIIDDMRVMYQMIDGQRLKAEIARIKATIKTCETCQFETCGGEAFPCCDCYPSELKWQPKPQPKN